MTSVFSIRPCRLEDVVGLYECVQESIAELTPWMPWCHPAYRQEETANWIERSIAAWEAKTEFNFVIFASEGTILGTCGLNRIDHPDGTANLGYWVRTSAAGQGAATRAAELLRNWAFENTSLHRLEIMASAENIGSQRVAEKLGACREGVLRQRMILRGRKHDAVLYSMLRVDDQAAEMVLQN